MSHRRIAVTVAFITVGYLVVLSLWLGLFFENSAEGTEGFQVMFLVALYGSALGLGMMLAGRPTRSERKIEREGFEGWATILSATPLKPVHGSGQLTELDLEFTVPGSDSYRGRVVYEVAARDVPRFAPGNIVTVFVDPDNRDRILLCP
jgi:hypothetical protein